MRWFRNSLAEICLLSLLIRVVDFGKIFERVLRILFGIAVDGF